MCIIRGIYLAPLVHGSELIPLTPVPKKTEGFSNLLQTLPGLQIC